MKRFKGYVSFQTSKIRYDSKKGKQSSSQPLTEYISENLLCELEFLSKLVSII